MKIPVRGEHLLSKEQEAAVKNKPSKLFTETVELVRKLNSSLYGVKDKEIIKQEEMSNAQNDNYFEQQKELEEEQRYPMTPNELSDKEKAQFTIESDLMTLGTTLARLYSKGISREIIADTIINSSEYQDLNQLCGRIDSFLREVKI